MITEGEALELHASDESWVRVALTLRSPLQGRLLDGLLPLPAQAAEGRRHRGRGQGAVEDGRQVQEVPQRLTDLPGGRPRHPRRPRLLRAHGPEHLRPGVAAECPHV